MGLGRMGLVGAKLKNPLFKINYWCLVFCNAEPLYF